jgi:hypothetical protein
VTLLKSNTSGGGYGASALRTQTTVSQQPLWIRADVAYLRQDFSIMQQPVLGITGVALPANERTDYLVRERPLTEKEIRVQKARSRSAKPSAQRDALLFALRELAGKNLGSSFDDWKDFTPLVQADPGGKARDLADRLVKASFSRQQVLLAQLRDGKGPAYTDALVKVIPRLTDTIQASARDALAVRLAALPSSNLRNQLWDDDEEIRRAAIVACSRKKDRTLVPDLISLVADGDPSLARSAARSLKGLTGQDFGPTGEAAPEGWASAAQAWGAWWKNQKTEQPEARHRP